MSTPGNHLSRGLQPRVSLVIPAFNEVDNLQPLMERVDRLFAQADWGGEVVLINDGSTDGTREAAEACAARYPYLRVFHHRRNLGLTQAIATGFSRARGEVVVFLPADLQSHPDDDVPKLLTKLAEGYDVVAGWRQGRREGKAVASWVYNNVSKWLFGVQAHDMNWIKAFRREVVADLALRSDWHRFILHMLADKGYRIVEVPTQWYPRHAGVSKFGRSRLLVSLFDVLALKFLLTFSRAPMRFFGAVGLVFILAGVGLGAYLAWAYFTRTTQFRPLFWLALALILLGGLVFLAGFLAEMIVDLGDRLEVQRRLRDQEHSQ